MTSTGRGGAGNLRSRSRDASAAVEDAIRLERQYTKEKEALQGEQVVRTPASPYPVVISSRHLLPRPFTFPSSSSLDPFLLIQSPSVY